LRSRSFFFIFISILSPVIASGQSAGSHKEREENIKTIIFFGDSLTAGFGLSADEAYPALIQKRLQEIGIHARVINSGVSGDTTAAGLSRLPWSLRTKPDIFVLALGANDGLRGLPLGMTEKNLVKIIQAVREGNPKVRIILAGMEVPPNLGDEYCRKFRELFPRIALSEKTAFIPFLLEGVAGIREMNQADGIHPTVKGQEIIAITVWKTLLPFLN
jgi:acyl-CoA thioesterase-1